MTAPAEVSDDYLALSAKDGDLGNLFSTAFLERFEVHSYRNASRILFSANPTEMEELVKSLMKFSISTEEIVSAGGNKSSIAKNMDTLLHPLGWHESRIVGDLIVRRLTVTARTADSALGRAKKAAFEERKYRIKNYIDGHKIDFLKNRVAFDMEWNSKDQTFDRDLYAARTFYECGIIDVGVLLTRSKALGSVFSDIGSRINIKDFKAKYGASTTWMGKLLYRLDAGRGGGCPILALGIKPAVIHDLGEWKSAHPVRDTKMSAQEIMEGDADSSATDEV